MAIKLDFDLEQNIQTPTFVLATRNGTKIGQLVNITGIRLKGAMKDPECTFTVHKYDGNEVIPYWDDIKDFKLVWCKETDTWFEIKVDANVSDDISKQVSLQRLGEAELSQIKIYGMEVNTEDDILRDDYVQPTVFYNEDKPTASLLHRIMDKAPHYRIRHIDEHLKGIQKIFSFNDKPLKECFDEIEETMDILFVYDSKSKEDGTPDRTIDVYDLKSYCKDCGARGSFVDKCLNCGSTNITEGYGIDTGIFVSSQDLGQEITIKVNADEVKNCYRLEGGDDLMTATIRNCNPNGTSYIWDFSDVTKEDMDDDLVELLEQYKEDYDYYKNSYVSSTASLPVSNYNALVNKYNPTSEDLNVSTINKIVGYAPIMQHYYDAIDLEIYLQSGLLPNITLQDTNAQAEANKLTADKLSPVAVVSNKYITLANASTAVLNAAKIASDPRYQIKVNQSSLTGITWRGNFTVTNYSDERDTCVSSTISVTVNDDYATYIDQKLKKTLYNGSKGKYGSIAQMIDMDATTFQSELKKYNLTALTSFNACFTECLNLLSEQGVDQSNADLYNSVYLPIYNKIGYIQSEISIREGELVVVRSVQNALLNLKQVINDKLDLEKYLGTDKWLDFSAYRREETFSNGNYISDYLNNKELFERAEEFFELAEYEISKSAHYKHEISSTLKNLLTIKEFKPLVENFECGNWIRVIDDNGEIYKLRLVDYEIDFDNLDNISVTLSDVIRIIDGLAPVREILVKSSDIINNYNAAMNKTHSNFESINDSMTDMVVNSNISYDYIYNSSYDIKDYVTQNEEKIVAMVEVYEDSIMSYVNDENSKLSSRISQNSSSISSEVWNRQNADSNLSSRIKQTATDISMTVTNGDTTSGIKITVTKEDGTSDTVSGTIEMTGLVKFTDLSGSGTTTIDGSNIKTGTIDAKRIDADSLKVKAANITGTLKADQIDADYATVTELNAITATVNSINANYVKTNELNVVDAKIEALRADYIVTDKIITNVISGGVNSASEGTITIGSIRAANYYYFGGTNYDKIVTKYVEVDGVTYRLLGY